MKLKIVSYNIWHGHSLEKVIDFLQREQADIICLQEVATSGQSLKPKQINIFQQLKHALQLKGVFEPAFACKSSKGEWNLGQATFASSLTAHKTIVYETGDVIVKDIVASQYSVARNVLITTHTLGSYTFKVANTHFTITPNATITPKQLKAAEQLRDSLVNETELILAGDMNSLPGKAAYQLYSSNFTDVTDPKTPTLHPTIHKVGHLGFHVDYIMYRGTGINHLKTEIPIIDASDHLPVIAEFNLN